MFEKKGSIEKTVKSFQLLIDFKIPKKVAYYNSCKSISALTTNWATTGATGKRSQEGYILGDFPLL